MLRRHLLSSALALASQQAGADQRGCSLPLPDASFPSADLGDLYDIVAGIGCGQSPSLSFLDGKWKSLEAWKRTARPIFRNLLHYAPVAGAVSAETNGSEQRDGFRLETVSIKATGTYDIPAWVLVPTGRKGKLPALVAIHCHSGRYVWGHEKIISSP